MAKEEVSPLLAASGKLTGWKRALECLENQSLPEVRVVGLGVAGGVDGHGSGGVIRHEVAAAVVAVGAGEWDVHESVRDAKLGGALSLNLNLQHLGPNPIPDGYGCLAVPETAPSWHLLALQRDSTDWQQACS